MKKFILASLLLAMFGCNESPMPKSKLETDNKDYDVSVLFEVEGCKVYRFKDDGWPRYFTNCQGSVSWTEAHGKTRQQVEIPVDIK